MHQSCQGHQEIKIMQDLAALNRESVQRAANGDFTRYLTIMAATRFRRSEALAVAAASNASERVREVIKTGVTSMGTSGSALSPYQSMASGFLGSLSAFSVWDKIWADGSFRQTPLKTQVAILSSSASGSGIISELAAKPLSAMSFTTAAFTSVKCSGFIVISTELARHMEPASMALIGDELRRAVALATDTIFLDVLSTGTGVASAASSGDFGHDLMIALDSIDLGASSRPYVVVSPNAAKKIALQHGPSGLLFPNMRWNGGNIGGVPVLVSDAAQTTTNAYVFDAQQVAGANETITLVPGDHATFQPSDNPTAGPAAVVSLWQNDLVGLKAERVFGCELLRSSAAAVISDMNTTV
jgi:HK97 family phage major capsid protein